MYFSNAFWFIVAVLYRVVITSVMGIIVTVMAVVVMAVVVNIL